MDNTTMPPLDIAKQYVADNCPHMADGDFSVNTHTPTHDLHLVDHLDGVESEHFDTDDYNVVTVQKNVSLADNTIMPQIMKIKVKDGAVASVLHSKAFSPVP